MVRKWNFFDRFSNALRNVLSGNKDAGGFFSRYMGSFLLVAIIFILIIISKFHTQSIYQQRLAAEKELQSIEAIYSKTNEAFRNSTLNSKIIEEVKRRNIPISIGDLPPIVIE